jgi:sulfide:quinone oxidoreductase
MTKQLHTVVVGGNFAGLTAALELKRKGKSAHRVTVVSNNPVFTFIPSLIWVPLGWREIKDITVPIEPILKKAGVEFVHAEALEADPETNILQTTKGDIAFDHLVIATGPKVDFDVAPGVREHVHYIGTPGGAMKTREALKALKENPGPVIVGATQSAGCMGAGYEFLFNVDKWLREEGIRDKVDLYWTTPETFLGHFGIEGIPGGQKMLEMFCKMYNIKFMTQVGVEKVGVDKMYFTNGTVLDYKFAMLMPPFKGVDFVTRSTKLHATANGYLKVKDSYQHVDYPHIWAAGISVDVVPPFEQGEVPFGVPKTGFPADEAGKVVAENILRISRGETKLKEKPFAKIPGICVMDAGKKEVIIFTNHIFKPRQFAVMIPNVIYDFNKRLFEKYFLWKTRKGFSFLP